MLYSASLEEIYYNIGVKTEKHKYYLTAYVELVKLCCYYNYKTFYSRELYYVA